MNRSHRPTRKQKLKFIFRNIRGIVHHKEGHWGGNEHGMDIGEGTTDIGKVHRGGKFRREQHRIKNIYRKVLRTGQGGVYGNL